MEFRYQNTRDDFKAYYEQVWGNRKGSQRNEYYHTLLWYIVILGLGAYVALKHGEVFAVAIFGVLAVFYIVQNWSFMQKWNAQAEAYADLNPECPCHLLLDERGATERFSNIQVSVPWSEIHDYTLDEDRAFIHYLKHRAFIVPFRHLVSGERDKLIEVLETNNVRKRS